MRLWCEFRCTRVSVLPPKMDGKILVSMKCVTHMDYDYAVILLFMRWDPEMPDMVGDNTG